MRALRWCVLALALSLQVACSGSVPKRATQVYGSYAVAYETAAKLAEDPDVPDDLIFRLDAAFRVADPVIDGLRGALVTYLKAKKAGESEDKLEVLLVALRSTLEEAEKVVALVRAEGVTP